jgi:hypothetical protein
MVSPISTAQPLGLSGDIDAPQLQDNADAARHLAWLTSKRSSEMARPYHYLLVLRFALINLVGAALLGAAYVQGLVDMVLIADKTYISAVIFAVFVCGLALCGQRVWQTSQELNQVKSFDPLVPSRASEYLALLRGRGADTHSIFAASLRLKLSQRVAVVRQIAGSLVLLGLIGTVVGFIIALSGVHPETASDVKAITPMVSTLIAGMSTALYTTLVGSVLNVWLMINYQLLAGGTVKLITSLLEFGEEHAGS